MQSALELFKLRQIRMVSAEDVYQSLSVSAGTTLSIVSIRTRTSVFPFLVFLGNAVETGAETFITWNLTINGGKRYPYQNSQMQWAIPNRPTHYLPFPIELSQNDLVEIQATNSDSSARVCTARFIILNTEPLAPLVEVF